VDGADEARGFEQRVEQVIVVDARQGIERLDAVSDQGSDDRLGSILGGNS